jgi:outer membrane protein OmpA-like peptidoglycan-associated protein
MQRVTTIVVLIFGVIFLGACSSKSTIVLVDSGKKENAIVVATDKGVATLDRVGTFVELKDKSSKPSSIKVISKEEIAHRFGETLAAEPKAPARFILYFKSNSTILDERSKSTLQKALRCIVDRAPCMVDIIGHTDTIGDQKRNLRISKDRAKYIKKYIVTKEQYIKSLKVKGYGEEDLLIPTADNVAEARNRNVEIFIK